MVALWMLAALVAVFVGTGEGKYGVDRDKYRKSSLSCFECNSAYDPRCGDPFDPYSIGMINCSLKRHPNHINATLPPSLCRKTVQKVEGQIRVIRGCGYITDERDDKDCMRRSGTHEIQVHYCACTKSFCNGGPPQIRPTLPGGLLATAALFALETALHPLL